MNTDSLFTPTNLGNLTVTNRVVMAPMTRVRAGAAGVATPTMATYYAQRATAGLIVTEGVQPSVVGQANPGTPGLHTDEQARSWRQVTEAVHARNGRIFAQLMHGGRLSHHTTSGHQPVAPSAVQYDSDVFTPTGPRPAPTPRALETDEVPEHVAAHAEAALRAIEAGFDGVEVHGANGYLVSQFLSSNVNRRTDEYGGSIENKIRFAVEVTTAVVRAIGAGRVGIRLSPGGGVQGVLEEDTLELYTALLAELSHLGLAYVHLEATTDDETLLALRRAWIGTMILNPSRPGSVLRSDRADAERWLGHGFDLISFGRLFISNPDLVDRLRADLPLAPDDEATWYAGGTDGYVTYPPYQRSA